MALKWHFGDGTWWAYSDHTGSDGRTFDYWIGVCDDGTFDVMSETDSELLPAHSVDCFPSLDAAKAWCQANEKVVDFSEVGR